MILVIANLLDSLEGPVVLNKNRQGSCLRYVRKYHFAHFQYLTILGVLIKIIRFEVEFV